MKNKQIKDNPSFLDLKKQFKGFESLSMLFDLLGLNNGNVSEQLAKIPDMKRKLNLLANIPDRFNYHFAKNGWIAYESMNFTVMEKAVEFADLGDFENAEKVLIEYYCPENMSFLINRLSGIKEFSTRLDLIKKAYEDYLAERYHSSIPVVLMMIDGVANDIVQKGFFVEGTDLTAWDTIAAHSTGLSELSKIFGQSRKKTVTEEIKLPYRNGILHGRDLGYANRIVAAKTWAALFAVRDWAASIKSGKKEPVEEQPATISSIINDLMELSKKQKELDEAKKRINDWKPRDIKPTQDYSVSGVALDYPESSPERAVIEFIELWRKENYGKMADNITNMFSKHQTNNKLAGEMRKIFESKKLIKYEILSIRDEAPAISEVKLKLEIRKEEGVIIRNVIFRMLNENEDGEPIVRGDFNGSWMVVKGYQELEFI